MCVRREVTLLFSLPVFLNHFMKAKAKRHCVAPSGRIIFFADREYEVLDWDRSHGDIDGGTILKAEDGQYYVIGPWWSNFQLCSD